MGHLASQNYYKENKLGEMMNEEINLRVINKLINKINI
jgi:hypothetical protein